MGVVIGDVVDTETSHDDARDCYISFEPLPIDEYAIRMSSMLSPVPDFT